MENKQEFNIQTVAAEVSKNLEKGGVVFAGKGRNSIPTIPALSVSFAVCEDAIGIEITINQGVIELFRTALPGGEFDKWCAETAKQIGGLPWFRERSEALTKLIVMVGQQEER